jgi:hypothetical protein
VWGKALEEILRNDDVLPDFEYAGASKDANLDCIHRACDGADIYFVSNQKNRPERAECLFRVGDRQPEIWDSVTGMRWQAPQSWRSDGRT